MLRAYIRKSTRMIVWGNAYTEYIIYGSGVLEIVLYMHFEVLDKETNLLF